MYDQPAIEKSRELIWRRFTDPFQILGWDMPSWFWGVVLGVVLVAAFFYVAWMYVKDSRGVGLWWATFLGLLRSAVYVILALVFLLPAWQEVETSTNKSKVLILFDPTASMTDTRDDLPEPGKKFEELLTRQEKVLAFLKQKEFGFIKELVEKNPVTAYRFGSRIDENFVLLTPDGEWTRDEWEERARELDPTKRPLGEPLSPDFWSGWLLPNRPIELKDEAGAADKPKSRLGKLAAHNAKLDELGVFKSTNVTQAALDLLTREMNKMVQGIIVVTDGRNTASFSAEDLLKLEERARSAKIPFFVVGVGTNRPQVRIEVVDLRTPKVIRPEDTFKAQLEGTAEGMPDQPANMVVDVVRVHTSKDGREDLLDIIVVEAETKDNKGLKKEEINLGKKLTLQPIEPVKFDRSAPPRASVEFQFDAVSLARAAGKDLTSGDYAQKKWEIAESRRGTGKEGDELLLQGRIAADPREIFPGTALQGHRQRHARRRARPRQDADAARQREIRLAGDPQADAGADVRVGRHARLPVRPHSPGPRDGKRTRAAEHLPAAASRRDRAQAWHHPGHPRQTSARRLPGKL